MKLKCLLLFLLSGVTASVLAQTTVDLGVRYGTATSDDTIFQNMTGNSWGGPGIFVGDSSPSTPRRGLIAFDLSSIPVGATIDSVQLTLTVGMIAGGGSGGGITRTGTIGLFAETQAWGPGTTGTTNVPSLGGNGNGATANAGDATWSNAASSTTPWTTAVGGNYILGTSVLSASTTVTDAGANSIWSWSGAGMVANVQKWIDNSTPNFGWELINADEVTGTNFVEFYSNNGLEATGTTTSQLPVLEVTYTVPEPVSGSLAASAVLAILSLRPLRRRA